MCLDQPITESTNLCIIFPCGLNVVDVLYNLSPLLSGILPPIKYTSSSLAAAANMLVVVPGIFSAYSGKNRVPEEEKTFKMN